MGSSLVMSKKHFCAEFNFTFFTAEENSLFSPGKVSLEICLLNCLIIAMGTEVPIGSLLLHVLDVLVEPQSSSCAGSKAAQVTIVYGFLFLPLGQRQIQSSL